MVRDELSVLSAFLTVAEERSFTRAATRLGVSRSALSHAIQGLEDQIGVRLLSRTTRSVAPTEAGAQFLARLGPALQDIRGALGEVSGYRERPAGRLRLVVSRLAARMVLAPKLAQFARDFPDVVLDVTTTEQGRVDLVAAGFDAAWWRSGCRQSSGRRSSPRRAISRVIRRRRRRRISPDTAASTSGSGRQASTAGSSSRDVSRRR